MDDLRTLKEREEEIISIFDNLDDWLDKYQYIIDLGSELEPLAENEKNESTLIRGCQSQVWFVSEERNGRIYFRGESDAIIVKGVVALLIKVASGCTVQEVAHARFDFLKKISLMEHLSPTRSNGVLSMIHSIRAYALAVMSKDVLK